MDGLLCAGVHSGVRAEGGQLQPARDVRQKGAILRRLVGWRQHQEDNHQSQRDRGVGSHSIAGFENRIMLN